MNVINAIALALSLSVIGGTVAGLVTAHASAQERKADAAAWKADHKAKRHALMCKQFPNIQVCK